MCHFSGKVQVKVGLTRHGQSVRPIRTQTENSSVIVGVLSTSSDWSRAVTSASGQSVSRSFFAESAHLLRTRGFLLTQQVLLTQRSFGG